MTPRPAAPAAPAPAVPRSSGRGGLAATAPAGPRAPGRPRSVACDDAICRATLDVLADAGLAGVTIESVAARAGVGKATIYRRWSGKDDLLVDAVARLTEPVRPVLTGSLRGDLIALVGAAAQRTRSSMAARVMPHLMGHGASHPELLERYREQVIAPRRRRIGEVLRGGVLAGELRPELDIDFAIDLLIGPVIYRSLTRPEDPTPPDYPERAVDAVLSGLGVRPLSGRS